MRLKHSGTLIPEAETVKNTLILSDLIKEKYEEQDLDLPKLVFVARSGLEIAGTMCRHLGIGGSEILMAGVEKVSLSEKPESRSEFRIGQFPTKSQVADEHLLVVDVVCRSGNTLKFITSRLAEFGAASVKSAVIYDMANTNAKVTSPRFQPDYIIDNGQSLGYARFHWEWDELIAESELQ